MNKFKSLAVLTASLCASLTLNGCFMPRAHSMGASLMNVAHQPRVSGDSTNAEISLGVNAFGGFAGEGANVDNVKSGGGNVSFTYRMGGLVSPIFASASLGAFGGQLEFACTESRCSDSELKYKEWLNSEAGKDGYSFWDVQERLLVGADFNPGKYVIVGFAGGVQLFQGGGDYDDMRADLDEMGYIRSLEGRAAAAPFTSFWLGSRIGHDGKWGSVVAEFDMLYKNSIEDWTSAMMLNYFHTSGFYGGVIWNSQLGYELNVGKTFVF